MAKWGQGDPRWIVEERPDATNVNNWHWTEKNAGLWSQEKFKELFTQVKIDSKEADLKLEEIEKCQGEASVNNRKGKLIFFYEWELHLKWSGKLKVEGSTTQKGTIIIPNISEENDISDYDIQVTINEEANEENQKLKTLMMKNGSPFIKKQLARYLEDLKQEFTKGMILPQKDESKSESMTILTTRFNKKINMDPLKDESRKGVFKGQTTTICVTEKFKCRAQEFYDALTKIELVRAFTKGEVVLNAVKDGKFELFGGNIVGKFLELDPPFKIRQEWRYKQWPLGHISIVTINIEEKSDHTDVKLTQVGIPLNEAEITRNNWQQYYWDAMKQTFGFGSFFT